MELEFYKYHGAGNDFIMIDCREINEFLFEQQTVNFLCDRHLGIGADGLILLLNDSSTDFKMKYFNADGKEGSMCGNGGRCITIFARDMGLVSDKAVFKGIDGIHHAIITGPAMVNLKMIDIEEVKTLDDGFFLETGSPHYVTFRDNIAVLDVFNEGRKIRHQSRFKPDGVNVNFVETITQNEIKIRTFERGVENETLACGTGSVASAISSFIKQNSDKNSVLVHTLGGDISVKFKVENQSFRDVWLEGPVRFVYNGIIAI